jgi:hypothetical protein
MQQKLIDQTEKYIVKDESLVTLLTRYKYFLKKILVITIFLKKVVKMVKKSQKILFKF